MEFRAQRKGLFTDRGTISSPLPEAGRLFMSTDSSTLVNSVVRACRNFLLVGHIFSMT